MIDVRAIRKAIAGVLEGRQGSRGVTAGVFTSGVFDGQPTGAQQALSLSGPHRFDVRIGNRRSNGATFVSSIGSHSLVDYDVTIEVTTRTATTAELCKRDDVLHAIESDCDDAIQALTFPGNLFFDEDGNATGIASGLLQSPTKFGAPAHRITSQDWEAQLIKSEIVGLITLTVEANAA